MSRLLFIRVSAQTYDEKDVPKTWPFLYAAVWPDPEAQSAASPAALARKLVPAPQRGVLELADAFSDYASYADMPKERRQTVTPVAERVAELRRALDDALGNRDVRKASDACSALEEALDEAETALRGLDG